MSGLVMESKGGCCSGYGEGSCHIGVYGLMTFWKKFWFMVEGIQLFDRDVGELLIFYGGSLAWVDDGE